MPKAELVLELQVNCDPPQTLGRIGTGNAVMIPITGGTVSGKQFKGEVLPGGADWAVSHDNGTHTVDARYAIKANDGTVIQIFNGATARIDRSQIGKKPYMMVTTPRFVAPEGPHDWLNEGVFVGTLSPDLTGGSGVQIRIFRMT